MIVIIDYGFGNTGSIANMLKYIGETSNVSNDYKDISKASKLILPGVGNFEAAMKRLKQSGLLPVIEDRVFGDKIPLLGICLGM